MSATENSINKLFQEICVKLKANPSTYTPEQIKSFRARIDELKGSELIADETLDMLHDVLDNQIVD